MSGFVADVLFLIGPSGTPTIMSALTESSRSIRVRWSPVPFSDRNGIITQHRVEIRERTGTQSLDPPFYRNAIEEDTILVMGLEPYTNYRFRVEASTTVGAGDFSSPKEERTQEDGMLRVPNLGIDFAI